MHLSQLSWPKTSRRAVGAAALASLTAPGPWASDALLVEAERVLVRPGVALEDAAVLVREGRIVAVGPGLVAPEGAEVLRAPVVCAGFLDPWSVLGVDPESARDPRTSAATLTTDGVDPYEQLELREDALRAGITAARVQAGVRSEVGGVGAVIRTDPELRGPEIVLVQDACVAASVGLTRHDDTMDVFDRIDEVDRLVGDIEEGLEYRESLAEYEAELAEWKAEIAEKEEELEKDFKKAVKEREKDIAKAEEKGKEFKEKRYREPKPPRRPKVDPDAEVMARVADGELPLIVEVHRAAELRELLEGTREFPRLRLYVAGGTEASSYADELAEREIPVIVWPAPYRATDLDEYEGHRLDLAAELDAAGVRVLLGSGGWAAERTRDLPLLAAQAVGHGLDPDSAFAAVTLGAAQALDVADQLGSIERGKSADLLLLDGDPLSAGTRVLFVVSGGRVVVRPQ